MLTAILGLVAIAANETKNADLKARLTWITEQVNFRISKSAVPRPGEHSDQWPGHFLLGLCRDAIDEFQRRVHCL